LLTKQDLATFQLRANEAIQTKETELQTLTKEKERVKVEMDKLIQLHLKDQIPTDSFKGYFEPLDIQYKQLDASVAQTQGQLDFLKIQQLNGDHILENAENLYERWPALDLAVKRQIVEELTQSIVIDTEDITIKFGYTPILLPIMFQNTPNGQHNVNDVLPFSADSGKAEGR
jgi:site-specific DNA recombinase